MTEDEAMTKWCPHVREGGGTFVYNRVGGAAPPEINCIGSACMAWRWAQVRNPDWRPDTGATMWPSRHPDETPRTHLPSKTDGFCGLAGRP